MPNSWLEQQMKHAGFVESGIHQQQTTQTDLPAAAGHDAVFDPLSPDADWAGLVPKGSAGKRLSLAAAAHSESITRHAEYGITPKETAAVADAWSLRRRFAGAAPPCEVNLQGPTSVRQPTPPSEHFKTTYQASTLLEPTPLELKSEAARDKASGGRKQITTSFNMLEMNGPVSKPCKPSFAGCNVATVNSERAKAKMYTGPRGSLISSLGAELAKTMPACDGVPGVSLQCAGTTSAQTKGQHVVPEYTGNR
eukprot:TRINITY_DN21129_c0_g1_i1.p1 TRINITY_DN21129_c0_g1~~TRINITY_DN21129_c0_g1_i1.p1  ORF type:complete len:252 (-),score=27.69 TRINITY_DN21129_c0_g1_i1:352-1107(-)